MAPNQPAPSTAPPEVTAPPEANPTTRGKEVILPALGGLVFRDSASKIVAAGVAETGVDTGGIAMLAVPGFTEQMSAFLGKTLTFDGLNEIARQVVLFYRAHDHPLVDVAVPEQDVTSGAVQLVVTEFRAGAVTAQGNEWFSTDILTGALHVRHDETVDGAQLLEDIDWLNRNPFRRVDLIYRKADEPGLTDIVLNTADRLPIRVYAGYDNSGTPATTHDRWNLGFNWGNTLWLDQLFSYQFTSSDDLWHNRETLPGHPDAPTFLAHSVDWSIPLPWRDRIEIFGLYEQIVPRVGPDFDALGRSGQASLRYIVPFDNRKGITQEIQAGYDFKTTNNNLDFGGVSVSSGEAVIHQFLLGYTGGFADDWGNTQLAATFYVSPGGLSRGNSTAAFQTVAALASANYTYQRLEIDRLTGLPWGMGWAFRVVGQIADHTLLPTERLGLGGVESVRGYDDFAASGDRGVLVSNEIRSPPTSLLGAWAGDSAQFFAFWDWGSAHDKQAVPDAIDGATLSSIGAGVHYQIDRYVDFKLDYGIQLRRLPGAPERSQFGHVAMTVGY